MQNTRRSTTFSVDGHEVSVTFADSGNTTALGQVKQILLSSFGSNHANCHPGDILAIASERRDNKDGDRHRVP
ncbi:hypothetical protein SDC9_51427 [bioreactor metagenome]|uniref:Uncharacterized protein n=1 Tax=bioreactor metagenome TaxID=1076179 RepID=A0A644WNR9_9ZZZZ